MVSAPYAPIYAALATVQSAAQQSVRAYGFAAAQRGVVCTGYRPFPQVGQIFSIVRKIAKKFFSSAEFHGPSSLHTSLTTGADCPFPTRESLSTPSATPSSTRQR